MIKSLKIKVCGMRDAENICQLVQLPIDYIGFIFYEKSARYVGEKIDARILSLVPDYIKKTGVFVNRLKEEVLQVAKNNRLQAIQLHSDESPEFAMFMKENGFEVIKAFRIGEGFDFSQVEKYLDACDYFLFDTQTTQYGGSGQKFDWKILDLYKFDKPFFLSGGIGKDDKQPVFNFAHPSLFALDLNSRFEIQPGLKDIDLLKTFIEQ